MANCVLKVQNMFIHFKENREVARSIHLTAAPYAGKMFFDFFCVLVFVLVVVFVFQLSF